MSEEQNVYVLTAHDPYEEHDCPSIEAIFSSRESADAARVAKYEFTFGAGSSSEKSPYGGLTMERYYEIEEKKLLTKWTTPEWMRRDE